MSKQELEKRRYRLRLLIRKFAKQKFDARPLVEEYYRLTELYKQMGGNPGEYTDSLNKDYWKDPKTYANEPNNKLKIVSIVDGVVTRSRTAASKAAPKVVRTEQPVPIEEHTNPISINYYRINIVWEGIIDSTVIEQFFKEMCIPLDKKMDEHSLSYIYKGTAEGFKILKRAVNTMGCIMFPDNSFTVYGKEIMK